MNKAEHKNIEYPNIRQSLHIGMKNYREGWKGESYPDALESHNDV